MCQNIKNNLHLFCLFFLKKYGPKEGWLTLVGTVLPKFNLKNKFCYKNKKNVVLWQGRTKRGKDGVGQ